MNGIDSIFIGYFPKINVDINDFKGYKSNEKWISDPNIIEVCSVSNCMRGGPEDYIQHWKHNALGFYDSEELAKMAIQGEISKFTLFAYKLFRFCYQEGGKSETSKLLNIAKSIHAKLLSDNYKSIGFDVVSNSVSDYFECSALSCNCGYEEFKTNKFCLFDSLDYAIECQQAISAGNYESGEQYLIEVLKKDG